MEISIFKKNRFQFSDRLRSDIITAIRWACMFLFLYTAYAKLIDHHRFLEGLSEVTILNGFAFYISWFVPLAEILTFLLLLFPKSITVGFYAFISLMLIFTAYIISALIWEKNLPCNCGGVIEKLSWTQHIWFNSAFITLAIFAVWPTKSNHL